MAAGFALQEWVGSSAGGGEEALSRVVWRVRESHQGPEAEPPGGWT